MESGDMYVFSGVVGAAILRRGCLIVAAGHLGGVLVTQGIGRQWFPEFPG
jgi:hypothetical protein